MNAPFDASTGLGAQDDRELRKVPGAVLRPSTGSGGAMIRVPIHFHPDVFEILRKRAERDGSSFGEVVNEIVERGLGG